MCPLACRRRRPPGEQRRQVRATLAPVPLKVSSVVTSARTARGTCARRRRPSIVAVGEAWPTLARAIASSTAGWRRRRCRWRTTVPAGGQRHRASMSDPWCLAPEGSPPSVPSTVIARGSRRADQDPRRQSLTAAERRVAQASCARPSRWGSAPSPISPTPPRSAQRRSSGSPQARLRRLQRPAGEHPGRPHATAPTGGRADPRDAGDSRRPPRGGRVGQRPGHDRGRRPSRSNS